MLYVVHYIKFSLPAPPSPNTNGHLLDFWGGPIACQDAKGFFTGGFPNTYIYTTYNIQKHPYIHTTYIQHTYITLHYITLHTLHTLLHAYIHTCMHACLHTYIHYIHYIHTYIHT